MPCAVDIKVSFIIPARNSEATLEECLSSIYAQTGGCGVFEVLLIDNGSSDRTVDIAKGKGARVLEGPGLTVGALRNLGARNARGRIFAFVDSDCVISSSWLDNALPLFDDQQVGIVGAPTSVPENGTWVQSAWYMHRKKTKIREFVTWLPTENLLVRREVFEKINGFNEMLVTCEDVDLCYRIGESHKIISDFSISAVHLGEARTLRDFFRKERWRGKGNFRGIFLHGLRIDEIPSLLMVGYGLTAMLLFIVGIFRAFYYSDINTLSVSIVFWVFPPIAMAIRTSLKVRKFKGVFPLTLLYAVYIAARTVSSLSGRIFKN